MDLLNIIKLHHDDFSKTELKVYEYVINHPETIETYLHFQAINKSNVNLNMDNIAGKPVVTFLGIPVKCADQILNTESAVV